MQLATSDKGVRQVRRVRLEAYLAGGLGLMGVVPSVNGGVISINVNSPDITGVNGGAAAGGYTPIANWGGTGVTLLLRAGESVITPGYPTWGLSGANGNLQFSGSVAVPDTFSGGALIGSYNSFSAYSALFFTSFFSPAADIPAGKYLGFRFNDGVSTDWNYGWIELTWDSAAKEFYIKSAAYESVANWAITTPSAVPEPTSGAVVALLMGGAAARQWRKKRRESQASAGESSAS